MQRDKLVVFLKGESEKLHAKCKNPYLYIKESGLGAAGSSAVWW